MRFLFRSTLLFVAIMAGNSCNQVSYTISQTKKIASKSSESYGERILVVDSGTPDTLLHLRFSFSDDSYYLKQSPSLNLGISVKKTNQGGYIGCNLGFQAVSKEEKLPVPRSETQDNQFILTNYKRRNGNKGTEKAITIPTDSFENPVISDLFSDADDMKGFLELFKNEIIEALKGNHRLRYISSTAANLNSTTIEMKINYKGN